MHHLMTSFNLIGPPGQLVVRPLYDNGFEMEQTFTMNSSSPL